MASKHHPIPIPKFLIPTSSAIKGRQLLVACVNSTSPRAQSMDTASAHLREGETIGNYTVRKQLGEGSILRINVAWSCLIYYFQADAAWSTK